MKSTDDIWREVSDSYETPIWRRKATRSRRRKLFAANRCINGPLEDRPSKRTGRIHGPVVPGTGKCQACLDVAAQSRSSNRSAA